MTRGGYHATRVQCPDMAPPASQWLSVSKWDDQPGKHWGAEPHPDGLATSSSVPKQKKTWVVRQYCQYLSAPGPHGREATSKNTISGSVLHCVAFGERTWGLPQKGPIRSTKGVYPHLTVLTQKPSNPAAANQRLGPAPLTSHDPLGGRYFKNPLTKSKSE